MNEGRVNTVVSKEGAVWAPANGDTQIDLHATEAPSWDTFLEQESARMAAEEARAVEAAHEAAVAEFKELSPQQQVEQILGYGEGLRDFRQKAMQPDLDLAA